MRYRTYRRYASLTRALSRVRPDEHPVVSLDVFDTLLFRRVQSGDRVVHAVCRELAEKLLIEGIRLPVDAVMRARAAAFALEHRRTESRGGDREALLRTVIPVWLKSLVLDHNVDLAQWTEWVLQRELELETLAAFPNRELIDCLRAMRKKGIRLIYVSDMYLGKEILGPLLDANGFGGLFSDGYVSGDHGKLKGTGRLFRHVLEREGLSPKQLLHIGDNPSSDGKVPAGLGIRSWLMRMNRDRLSRWCLRKAFRRADATPEAAGLLADDFARVRLDGWLHPLEEVGFAAHGPVYAAYMQRFCEHARARGVSRVYFPAREGFTLKRLYEAMAPAVWPAGRCPEGEYLYVSRKSLMLPDTRYPDLVCLRQIAISIERAPRTLETVLRVLRVDGAVPDAVLQDCGFRSASDALPVDWANWFPLQRLFNHEGFLAVFQKTADCERQEALLYLRQAGFFTGKRAAFTNVGWLGYEFERLADLVSRLPDAPQMDCYLLGTHGPAAIDSNPRYQFVGLLSDQSRLLWNANCLIVVPSLLENPLRGPHGSTHGYEGGRAVLDEPEHPSRQVEAGFDAAVALIQSGILRYGAEYAAFLRLTGYRSERFVPAARSAASAIAAFPRRDLAAFWLSTQSDVGLGTTTSFSVRGDRLRRRDLLNPISFYRKLRRTFWLGGSIAEMGVPGLNTLGAALLAYRLAFGDSSRPRPKPDDNAAVPAFANPPADPAHRVEQEWERDNWDSFVSRWRANLELGRQWKCPLKNKRRSLGLGTVVAQEMGRAITNVLCAVKRKPRFPRDGVSIGSVFHMAWLRLIQRVMRFIG